MEHKRRSEPLTKEEHKALKKFVSSFYTKLDAASAIGVSRQVLDLVLLKGTGSTDSIRAIRVKLNSVTTGAEKKRA